MAGLLASHGMHRVYRISAREAKGVLCGQKSKSPHLMRINLIIVGLQDIAESESSRGSQIQMRYQGRIESQIGRIAVDLALLPQVAVVRLYLCISVPLRKDNDVPPVMNSSHMSFLMIQRKVYALRTSCFSGYLNLQSVRTKRRNTSKPLLIVLLLVGIGIYAWQHLSSRSARTLSYIGVEDAAQFQCQGKRYCSEMTSCEEATFYLRNCPVVEINGDGDGIPCESQFCGH
jgi:hypothetical protein